MALKSLDSVAVGDHLVGALRAEREQARFIGQYKLPAQHTTAVDEIITRRGMIG